MEKQTDESTKRTLVLAASALLVSLVAVALIPSAAATDPYACVPDGSVCAGGWTSGDPDCHYGEDSAYITTPDGGWVSAFGFSSCWESSQGPRRTDAVIVSAGNPAVGFASASWAANYQDGEMTGCSMSVRYNTDATGFQSENLGCPAGPPPALPWGEFVPVP